MLVYILSLPSQGRDEAHEAHENPLVITTTHANGNTTGYVYAGF